jgi:hypothetical protein
MREAVRGRQVGDYSSKIIPSLFHVLVLLHFFRRPHRRAARIAAEKMNKNRKMKKQGHVCASGLARGTRRLAVSPE